MSMFRPQQTARGINTRSPFSFIESNTKNFLFPGSRVCFNVHFLKNSFSPNRCHCSNLFGENRREGKEKKGQKKRSCLLRFSKQYQILFRLFSNRPEE